MTKLSLLNVYKFHIDRLIMNNMQIVALFIAYAALTVACTLTEEPNEQCKWRGLKDCPVQSSGSGPICDNTNPTLISPGLYSMKVCASQTPKAIGGKFDVGVAIFGTIQTVDVIPQSSQGENNINCSNGEGSVGTRVFSAHCELTGPGKMRGYWAITYKPLSVELILAQ